jgi:hypothetical protein
MRHIALAGLTAADLPPTEIASTAAEAGYQGVSVVAGGGLKPAEWNNVAPPWDLVDDPQLRRDTHAAG